MLFKLFNGFFNEKLTVKTLDVDSTSIDVLGKGDFKILIDVNLNND